MLQTGWWWRISAVSPHMLEEQSRTDAALFRMLPGITWNQDTSQLSCIKQSEPKIFHLVKTIRLKLHFGSTYMCPQTPGLTPWHRLSLHTWSQRAPNSIQELAQSHWELFLCIHTPWGAPLLGLCKENWKEEGTVSGTDRIWSFYIHLYMEPRDIGISSSI